MMSQTQSNIRKAITSIANMRLSLTVQAIVVVLLLGHLQALDDNETKPPDEQCAMLNQVQSVVIQLLSGHFEISKGLQVLTDVSDNLQLDVHMVKNTLAKLGHNHTDIRNLFLSMVAANSSDTDVLPNTSEALQNLRENLAMQTNDTLSIYQSLDYPTYLIDILNRLDEQDRAIKDVEKIHKRMLRKYNEIKSSLEHYEDHIQNATLERAMVQHFLTNQKEINGKLLNSIRYMEQNLKEMTQSDSPYLQPQGCPQNYVRNFLSCYRFVNDTMNWIEAEKYCQRQHPQSHLVGLETTEEEDFIVKFRNYNKARWTSMYIWTGGTDMGKEAFWIWVNTGRPMTYTNWRPNQPDSHNNNWQNCVYLRTDGDDHRWDDWHCDAAKLNFVCEIELQA